MMTGRKIPRWFPFVLLLGALIALYYPLLRGETLFWGLPSLQFYPWRQFAFAELSAGRLPTWNPYLGAGAPLLANYQTAVFYPPNWLHLVLPGPLAMSVIALSHVVWAGLGMWLFTGALNIPTFGRGISLLAYAFSGYFIARLGSFPTADAVAWVPWLFWLVHRVVTGRRASDVGWLALVFALQLLAGHAQTVWYSAVGVGLYALWLVFNRSEDRSLRATGLALAGIGMALGTIVAAVQLLPTAEYLLESQRSGGMDFDTLTNFSYHPLRLLMLFSPNIFGTPADGSYLTKGVYYEDAAYIGFIPLIAAFAALIARFRQRRTLDQHPLLATVSIWGGLALLGFFLAMGRHNPLFRPLAEYVPTFDTFRDPARWLILVVFSFSVLAGIGVAYWGRGPRIVFWSRLSAAGGGAMAIMAFFAVNFTDSDIEGLTVLAKGLLVLGCWIAGAALFTLTQPLPDAPTSPAPIAPFLWRTAVLLFIAFDLAGMSSGLNPTISDDFFTINEAPTEPGRIYWFADYEDTVRFGSEDDDEPQIDGYFDVADYRIATENWQETRASLLPNINMLDRVPALNNFDPLLTDYQSQYIELIEERGAAAGNLLQAAGVTRAYGITPDGWQGANPAIAPDADSTALAWLVPEAIWFNWDDEITGAVASSDWNPAVSAILASNSSGPSGTRETNIPGPGTVTITPESPTETRYHVATDRAAYLVISQTWYPGWHATLDGEKTDLYRANLAFQAVAVPSGEHEIVVSYTLNRWGLSVALTALGLMGALGLIGWGLSRTR